ncbi:MAG: DUF364 domain-containing protein [Oscillospiraceae bacterium]|nr:DUF364 domain-containing protein [Oscillospiraceae bacterium]
MKKDFFALYDMLCDGVMAEEPVKETVLGERWALVETAVSSGIAMFTAGNSIEPLCPTMEGKSLREAARCVKSWNMEEASLGLAAINAARNTMERIERLGGYAPMDVFYTDGIDLKGKTVALIGHMHGPRGMREQAKAVYILERAPQPGDYPDSACDWILPQCDLVIITGSSLINKTLPHLLELCEKALTILTGPSVPLCPELLDFGIDRIAGMAVADRAAMHERVVKGLNGLPYGEGMPFLLKRR